MQPLGVGLVYWTALAPLFDSGEAAVLELEPQTLWTRSAAHHPTTYRLNEPMFESIAQRPQRKLVHGVGQPFGGTVDDPTAYLPLMRQMVDRLDPAWVSEHLSFNRVLGTAGVQEAGFLLPPPQHAAAARVAAANIRRYAAALQRPVAFETGVNYLRPVAGQMPEGAYFRSVAEQADCGILLDLHNLWCNERNGRQRVVDALAQIPLDRVWEVHFAGGMLLDGFWLDGHSGAIPGEVIDLAADLIPALPNVGALIFEILPEHLHNLGLDGVHRQLQTLERLWQIRPAREIHVPPPDAGQALTLPSDADVAETRAWEAALIATLSGADIASLALDPGIGVLRQLIRDFRSANVTRALKFTMTALIITTGLDATRRLLDAYFTSTPPDTFAAMEAHHFADYLARRPDILGAGPYLAEVLAFERALIAATVYGETTEVRWSTDPAQLLQALEIGRLPVDVSPSKSRMVIVP